MGNTLRLSGRFGVRPVHRAQILVKIVRNARKSWCNGRVPVLRELLDRENLGLVAVYLPDAERRVSWIAATELVEPGAYLDGDELVLTTALALADADAASWRRYVAGLARADAAALGLGTGIALEAVPDALHQACQEAGLNLLEVPVEVSFVSISRAVGEMLRDDADRRSSSAAEEDEEGTVFLQQMTRAAARDNQDSLLRALAAVLRGSVAVHDPWGRAVVGPYGPAHAVPDPEEVAACIRRIRPSGMRGAGSVQAGAAHLVVRPVGVSGDPEYYLVTAHCGELTRAQVVAADLAWSFLNLGVESERTRAAWLRRLVEAAAGHLLAGREVAAQALRTEIDVLAVAHRPAQVRHAAAGRAARWRVARVEASQAEAEGLSAALVRTLLERPAARVGSPLLWCADPAGQGLLVLGEAEQVMTVLCEGPGAAWVRRLRVGVSAPVRREDLRAGAAQARSVCAHACHPGEVVPWEDVGAPSVVELVEGPAAQDFARLRLRGVLERPELLELLGAYLREGGVVGRVASRLGVHRNSVPARVARLGRVLGVDLDDPDERASLWVALRVLDRADDPRSRT